MELLPVSADDLVSAQPGEPSAAVRERVVAARVIQTRRFAGRVLSCNADLCGEQVRQVAKARPQALSLLHRFIESHSLSGRAHARLLKVARTIADLEGAPVVEHHHLAEALQYRAQVGGLDNNHPRPAALPDLQVVGGLP